MSLCSLYLLRLVLFFESESFLYVFILYLCRQLSESSNTDSEVILCRVMGN